jgi:threonine dehydrogenase-like Zn-dependent dehydrogenase
MRGVRFLGNSVAETGDFPEIEPGPNEVLVRLRSSGLCGSDLARYRADAVAGNHNTDIRPGHEPCGEVVALGPGVTQVEVGDRIMQHHYDGCLQCIYCKSGWQQLCPVTGKRRYYGGSRHGGHGDYMTAHESTCVRMPDAVSFEEGAYLACGASTAFHALKKLDVSGRDVLAVFGQGPVGLAATMFGEAMGARVIAIDINSGRLQMAKDAGAWKTIDNSDGSAVDQVRELTHGEGADATLEAAGLPQTRVAAAEAARVFGRACLVGEGGEVTYQPTPHIIHRHLTLIGSWTFSTFGLAEAAQFVADREVSLRSLITRSCSIEDAPEAYTSFAGGMPGKFVISWPG